MSRRASCPKELLSLATSFTDRPAEADLTAIPLLRAGKSTQALTRLVMSNVM